MPRRYFDDPQVVLEQMGGGFDVVSANDRMHEPSEEKVVCGGFLFLNATEGCIRVWRQMARESVARGRLESVRFRSSRPAFQSSQTTVTQRGPVESSLSSRRSLAPDAP